MKRISMAPAILFFLGMVAAPVFGDEMTEVYSQIYHDSQSLQDKYSVIQSLVALDDRIVAPILGLAFVELLNTQNSYKEASEKALYGVTVRVVAEALGKFKHTESAVFLWQGEEQMEDTLARAECIMSLGRMRADDYAEKISLLLRNLNDDHSASNADSDEKIAYACIIALSKIKDVQGFKPVFFASDGWYSQRVRSQALKSLPDICADPTDPVQEIVRNETGAVRKYRALALELGSKAAADRKIQSAGLGLFIGHSQDDVNRKTAAKDFSTLRKTALRGLIDLKAKDKGTYSLNGVDINTVIIETKSYINGFDDEEKILGLQALGINGSDAAAKVIFDLIIEMNQKMAGGVGDQTRNRMVMVAIEAAAASKNSMVKPALLAVQSNMKWSDSIIRSARNALANFGK
jgi:HEAT repeat protein